MDSVGAFLIYLQEFYVHGVKSVAEVHSKKANCFTIRVIQVAVDPVLN